MALGRESLLYSIRHRETKACRLKVRSFPPNFVKKLQQSQGSMIPLCIQFEKLLQKHSPLHTTQDVDAFNTVVTDIVTLLEIHTGTVDESVRDEFIAQGGPCMIQTLLHAAVLSPIKPNYNKLSVSNNNLTDDEVPPYPPGAATASTHVSKETCLSPEMTVLVASSFVSQDQAKDIDLGPEKLDASPENFELANQVLSVLTEVCLSHGPTSVLLSSLPELIPRLFDLMASPPMLDGAVSLAQELLGAGDLFKLDDAPRLGTMVHQLPPRALALFARSMAALFSKPEQPMDKSRQPGVNMSVPPPECMPPHLCASCANRVSLVNIPQLLPKLVQLLRSPTPPRRLWPARMLYHPLTGRAVPADDREDTWKSFISKLPPIRQTEETVNDISSSKHAHRYGDTTQGNTRASNRSRASSLLDQLNGMLGGGSSSTEDLMVVLPSDQLPPGVIGTRASPDSEFRFVKLKEFEGELWTTLQADLLFVVGTLLSNKAREKTQAVLIASGFIEMLNEMFSRLKWEPPKHTNMNALKEALSSSSVNPEAFIAAGGNNMRALQEPGALERFVAEHFPNIRLPLQVAQEVRWVLSEMYSDDRVTGEHGPGCMCYPQACLQMSLLRTIATFSEKTSAGATQHHLLLLSPEERKQVSAYTSSEKMTHLGISSLGPVNQSYSLYRDQELRAEEEQADDMDGLSDGLLCLSCVSIRCEKSCKDKSLKALKVREEEEKYYSMFTANSLDLIQGGQSIGIIQELVDVLMKQPPNSPFYYEIASTVHKWLQGARPVEQDLLLTRPGFLKWIVDQLLTVEPKKTKPLNQSGEEAEESADEQNANSMCAFQQEADVQQVLLDLIGELLKFNEVSIAVFDDCLGLTSLNASSSYLDHPSYGKLVKLGHIILDGIVNAAVLVSCMELTLGVLPTSLRPLQRIGDETVAMASSSASTHTVVNWVKEEEVSRLVASSAKRPTTGWGKQRRPFGTHGSFDDQTNSQSFSSHTTTATTYASMRVSQLKQELKDRGIQLKGAIEKKDMIVALEENDKLIQSRRDELVSKPPDLPPQTPTPSSTENEQNDTISINSRYDQVIADAALAGVSEASFKAFWRVLRESVAVALIRALSGRTSAKHMTDICVINATCVLLSEARAAGDEALVSIVKAVQSESSDELDTKSAEEKSLELPSKLNDLAISDDKSLATEVNLDKSAAVGLREGLEKALKHWYMHYEHQTYERKFVEYQSGIPFSEWRKMVKWIATDFIPSLPSTR